MTQEQYMQTVQAEAEYLLTKEAFHDWIYNHKLRELAVKFMNSHCDNILELYLGEHGLPITSKIEGV